MNNSKIEKNKVKIELVKKVQTKNIDAILAQAEKLKILEEKAEALEEEARIFSKTAHELKMKITWKRKRDKMLVLGILFFAVALSYIIGSPIQVLGVALAGGMILGGLYGNEGIKEKKEEPKNYNTSKPNAVYEKKQKEPIFNNSKNKKKRKTSSSENKISYAPKK